MTNYKNTDIFNKEDFEGTEVYEYLYSLKDNEFQQMTEIDRLAKIAKKCADIGNFKTIYRNFQKVKNRQNNVVLGSLTTNFDGQADFIEGELDSGDWRADDYGIVRYDYKIDKEIIACSHPILPIQCLKNVDEKKEKARLAYKRRHKWETIIVDMKTIANNTKIVDLADYGIAVNSGNAKAMVSYLHDVMTLNENRIPLNNSITRMGWIGDHGFSPYIDDLVFDGDSIFKSYYDCIGIKGSIQAWIDEANTARQRHIYNKIILAASFASVLVEPAGALPFFVHLWGDTSGSGKTVAMMLGASVWAKSAVGDYSISFKSTTVGHEVYAGFLNSLPLCMDELQVIKDKKDFDEIIYSLSEGSGKLRGSRDGGLRINKKWRNCMITTGEKPITNTSSGAGAINRIIDLDCSGSVLFDNGNQSVKTIMQNYGHAGKQFIEWLKIDENMREILAIQSDYERQLLKDGKTSKQALAASLILAADEITTRMFFDDTPLRVNELMPLLLTNDEISINKSAWDWLQDWIAENSNRFNNNVADVYGTTEANQDGSKYIYIIGNIFSKACINEGYTPKSFWNWLVKNDKVITDENGYKIVKKINGMPLRCVCVKIDKADEFEVDGPEKEVPF